MKIDLNFPHNINYENDEQELKWNDIVFKTIDFIITDIYHNNIDYLDLINLQFGHLENKDMLDFCADIKNCEYQLCGNLNIKSDFIFRDFKDADCYFNPHPNTIWRFANFQITKLMEKNKNYQYLLDRIKLSLT